MFDRRGYRAAGHPHYPGLTIVPHSRMTRSFTERARGAARRYWLRARHEWGAPRLSRAELRDRLVPGAGGDPHAPGWYSRVLAGHMAATPHALWETGAEVADAGFLERSRRGEAEILRRTFPVGADTDWLVEPFTGTPWPRRHVDSCPYRIPGSDLVLLWQLNKMTFLLDRAAAWRATGEERFARDVHAMIDSWCVANPWMVGPNWLSPMDAGTRLCAWSLALSGVAGAPLPGEEACERIVRAIDRHAAFVSGHFSQWAVPNNHLIGEAATLSLFAACAPLWREAPAWTQRAEETLAEEARRQVLKDGLQFENSFNYHLYALDYFLMYLHAVVARGADPSPVILGKTCEMADAMMRLVAPSGRMPMIGDDSMTAGFVLGSLVESEPLPENFTFAHFLRPAHARLFETMPWGRELTGLRATRAGNRRFHEAGIDVARDARRHLVFTHGPQHHRLFAHGHLHADAGGFELALDGVPVLIDPGTHVYGFDARARDHMRGARAHNTLLVDGVEPMLPAETFRWLSVAAGEALAFGAVDDVVATGCRRRIPGEGGANFDHVRALVLAGDTLIVADTIHARSEPGAGTHWAEINFHTPVVPGAAVREGLRVRLTDARRFVRVFEVLAAPGVHLDVLDDPAGFDGRWSRWYGDLRHGVTLRVLADLEKPVTVVSVLRDPATEVERLRARPGEIACAVATAHRRRLLTVTLEPFAVRTGGRVVAGLSAGAAAAPVEMGWIDELES